VTSPALVFNCHYNGLSIIQELGRRGIPTYALDSVRSVGTVSRYAQYWPCPNPLHDESAFIQYLMEKGAKFDSKPVLFPTNDHWANAISRHKAELEKWYLPCIADSPVVDLVINKDQFYKWAMERDYPVPRLYSPDEIIQTGEHIFPLIAKPIARRSSNLCLGHQDLETFLDDHRMTIIRNISEYKHFVSQYAAYLDYFLFQEFIPGMADQMYTVGIYANRNSEILGLFTGRKVRGFPPDIGDCIVGQGEMVPDAIKTCVRKLVSELRYSGIGEFEFKRDPTTGDFRLIEINPRSWSWIGITPACGVNLPWMAYSDMAGEPVQYAESNSENGRVVYLKLLEDLKNCLYSYKRMGYPEYNMSLKNWRTEMHDLKKVYAEFSWDDPSVALYSLLRQGGICMQPLLRRLSPSRK